jgi:hypothetical protein
MAKVWPDVTVGDGSLRFHIASLRKALGDGENGARYIATLGARLLFRGPGLCVERSRRDAGVGRRRISSSQRAGPLARMVGRADGVLALSSQLMTSRFVTIVGAGGVGKTTVAVAVGTRTDRGFQAGAVLFVDLGALSDPNLVAGSVASMLGLSMTASDAAPGLDRLFAVTSGSC